jgi:c(7)-type cytochrome triheme protein
MRRLILFLVVFSCLPMLIAQGKTPPAKLVFPSKSGDITFDHAAHAKRAKGGCKGCHDGLWPQSAKAPLKSSDGCRTCHQAGGKAFEMKGNCARCHAPHP